MFFKNKKIQIILMSFLIMLIFILRSFVIQIYLVSGNSMLPNFQNGNFILVNKFGYTNNFFSIDNFYEKSLKRLDVILFEDPLHQTLLKRIIGLPGDFYSFRENKIYIDNQDYDIAKKNDSLKTDIPEISQSIDSISDFYPMQNKGRIPPNYYLLLGDNRENSTDSRTYGLVPENRLRGKVLTIIFQ